MSSRACVVGIVWQRGERTLPLLSKVLHGVREGSETRVTMLDAGSERSLEFSVSYVVWRL